MSTPPTFKPATLRFQQIDIENAVRAMAVRYGYKPGTVTIGSEEAGIRGPTVYYAVVEVEPAASPDGKAGVK